MLWTPPTRARIAVPRGRASQAGHLDATPASWRVSKAHHLHWRDTLPCMPSQVAEYISAHVKKDKRLMVHPHSIEDIFAHWLHCIDVVFASCRRCFAKSCPSSSCHRVSLCRWIRACNAQGCVSKSASQWIPRRCPFGWSSPMRIQSGMMLWSYTRSETTYDKTSSRCRSCVSWRSAGSVQAWTCASRPIYA